MTRLIAFYLLGMMLITITAFADIYKCVSDDGVVTFSDVPCGKNAKFAFRDSNSAGSGTIDDFIGVVHPGPYNKNFYSVDSLSSDLKPQAINLGRRIFPNEQFSWIDARSQIYGQDKSGAAAAFIPFTLFFGSKDKETNYSAVITYGFKTEKGSSKEKVVLWLQAIETQKNSKDFDPLSMRDVKKLKKISTGRWMDF